MANIYIQDAGHGGTDPGAGANGHVEKVYTLEAATYVNKRLNELGIKSTMTRTTDVTLDSVKRTNIVKQSVAAVCLSHHFNAGGGDGTETIHSIHSKGILATLIAKAISAAGVKFRKAYSRKSGSVDFYFMHRMTGTVETVIVEYEFLDGPNNARLMDRTFRERLYEGTVKAVCEYEGVSYKEPTATSTPPKKEDEELKFSSPSLKSETETSLGSKAHRQIIVDAAVKAGAHSSWADKIVNGTLTDADVLGLAVKYTVAANK